MRGNPIVVAGAARRSITVAFLRRGPAGKQMVPVLNEIGVTVSCVGNHDFDYGERDISYELHCERT
jgi:2',3'-cyclic-nucleotide 2'-phosphodiesterase (5'-nucleotidase family)